MFYELNENDRICAVSTDWNDVAKSQGADALVDTDLIGSSVWSHILGRETQEFYADLFSRARRSNRPVRLPYRCDAPLMRRFFVMDIVPKGAGHIRIAHRIVEGKSEDFSIIHLPETEQGAVCSVCLSVHRDGLWRDDYFSPRGALEPDQFVVCPSCQDLPQYTGQE